MKNKIFESVKEELCHRPKQLTDLTQWLFVTINTARSLINNTAKSQFGYLKYFVECNTTSDIQYLFDKIQGKFGNKNFSQRYNPKYLYLCSLVANFPPIQISTENQRLINDFIGVDNYLLYEI